MTVVEHNFLDKRENDEFKDDPVKRRELTSEAAATPLHDNERHVHERNADYCLIHDHPQNSLPQLPTTHLQPQPEFPHYSTVFKHFPGLTNMEFHGFQAEA